MISNLKPYHPSAILQEKRIKQQEKAQAESSTTAVTATAAPAEGAEATAPAAPVKVKKEGLAGILQDTMDYLDGGLAIVEKLEKKFGEMLATLNQTLDLKLDDQDRKKINKDFVAQKKDFDDIAKTSDVGGDQLFSGKFAQKGKTLKIGLTEEESMVLRPPALHVEALGIARIRVDSLVNARKAQPILEKVKIELDEARKTLKARTETVSFKQAKIENAEKMNEEAEKNQLKFTSFNTDLEYYRVAQKRLAESKGRDAGLLLNIVI